MSKNSSYTPSGLRRFVVMTEPSVADPAWLIPVAELDHDNKVLHQYTNVDELLKVVLKMKDDLAEQQIRHHERGETLRILGISQDEYFTKLRATYEREAREKAELEQQIADAENEGM